MADLIGLNIEGSYLTLDSGFDSDPNRVTIKGQGLIPVIYPNKRNIKDPDKLKELSGRIESQKDIYQQRYRIERCFAWEDTYRRLVIRYERLQATHMGFKHLAFSMINLRSFLGKK